MARSSGTARETWLVVILVVAAVVAVYARTGGFGFVVYDDDEYVYANPLVRNGVTAAAVGRALTEVRAANWHPVTWVSHMLDVSLFGIDPGWHHLVNMALHAANAVLVFLLLRAAGPLPCAALTAFAFAVHPLHVESVAWISERKDLLSALFGLLAVAAYCRGAGRGREAGAAGLGWYLLSLSSKPMLVTLPLLLVVVDYWPLGRWSMGRWSLGRWSLGRWSMGRWSRGRGPGAGMMLLWSRLRGKWPFFLLAAASSAITLWAQAQGGAIQSLASYPLGVRLAHLPLAYLFYIEKMFWPSGLAVIYPHPGVMPPAWQVAGSGIVLLAVSVSAWRLRRRAPYFLAGWAWYLVALLPVAGLVQVGYQVVADRYSYLPLLGPMAALVWGGYDLARWWRIERPAAVLAATAILLLAVAAWQQVGYWRDSFSLFRRALAVAAPGRNFVAENHLGLAWLNEGDLASAEKRFRRALAIKADHFAAWNNLGIVMLRRKRWADAERCFRRALAIRPSFHAARTNLALALYFQGRRQQAVAMLEDALAARPDDPVVLDNLGNMLLELGRIDEAAGRFLQSIELDPGFAAAYADLGRAHALRGDRARAKEYARRALQLDPANQVARRLLGRR